LKEFIVNNAKLPIAALTLAGGVALYGPASTEDFVPVHAVAGAPTKTDRINLQKDIMSDLPGLGKFTARGNVGPLTLRGLCAERWLTGGTATRSRSQLTKAEVNSLVNNDNLISPFVPELGKSLKDGVVINETCQVGAVIRGSKVDRVFPVATGTKGNDTPNVVTKVTWGRRGMHDSTKYPSEDGNGNMENPLYFKSHSSIAIHGGPTSTKPLSRGCIRVPSPESVRLYQEAGGPADSPIDKPVGLARPTTMVVTGAYEYNPR